MELREMPVVDLIAEAEAVGINISTQGDRLRVRGPHNAEALGRLLLERKTEVLGVLLAPRRQAIEAASPPALKKASVPSDDPARWDADRAAAIVAEVDTQIAAALLAAPIAAYPARRSVLANEQAIVHRLAWNRDPFVGEWPRALRDLLARWAAWDAGRGT